MTRPPEATSVHDAFQLWKTAHDHLINAIATYASACTTLESSCSRARLSFSENNDDFDATLLTVEIELPRLETQQRSLANSMSTLKKARNLSYTLVPINILPPSLLLSVFSTLVDWQHANQTHLPEYQIQPHPALAISCVSTAWRNLTCNSPALWSSIFLHPKDQGDWPTQLSLVRANNALLDVQVSFPRDHTYDWLSLLHPRCEQIRSLDLVLADMDLLRAILSIWPPDSSAASVKSLSMKIMSTTYSTDSAPPKVLLHESRELFLQNLTRLSLYGGYFDWESAAFQGLEDLQLVGLAGRPGPTLGQIAAMLSSSPRLHTLCLGDMRVRSDDIPETPTVYLECLRKLSLMSFAEPDLCKILPLISPGSQPLTLHINYELVPGPATEAYIELLRRSTIESVYFHSRISRNTMDDVFSSLPHLRHLHLSRNRYLTNILQALAVSKTPPTDDNQEPGTPRLPCPVLDTIHLHDCKFKTANSLAVDRITDEPKLTIKLQLCEPPNIADVLLQSPVRLASRQIVVTSLADTEPPDDIPFYGLNQSNTFTLAKRTQFNNMGTIALDDGTHTS